MNGTKQPSGRSPQAKRLFKKQYPTFILTKQDRPEQVFKVTQSIDNVELIPTPDATHPVIGNIQLQGQVITVVDGRTQAAKIKADQEGVIVLVIHPGAPRLSTALLVDNVIPTLRAPNRTFIPGKGKVGKAIKTLLEIDRHRTTQQAAQLPPKK